MSIQFEDLTKEEQEELTKEDPAVAAKRKEIEGKVEALAKQLRYGEDARIAALEEKIRWAAKEKELLELEIQQNGDFIKLLEEKVLRLEGALESVKAWCEGSTCEVCGEKKMIDTDCYDIARKALEEEK